MPLMDIRSKKTLILVQVWVGMGLGMTTRPASCGTFSDDFGGGSPFVGVGSLTANNLSATAQPGEPAHAGEPATHSVWVRWSVPTTATYTVTVTNNTFDTV